MVRADLMDAIDRTLRAVGSSSVPFGGYQILLVGDLYQLPPVVKTNNDTIRELFNSTDPSPQRQGWSSPWFLDADVFAERKPMRIRLTKVFRQQDAKFVEILNDIRIYRNLQDDISFLNRCITVTDNSVPRRNNVTLVLRNDTAKKINDEKICQIASAPMLFHAIREGSFAACDVKDLPVEPDITLKKGTFVMIVYNDPNGAFVNGTTGIIQDLDPQYADVRLKNSNVVRISMYTWDSYKIVWDSKLKRFENMRDGSFTQIPLIPAYAITCHKAQGKTLDNVYLDFDGNAFASGQTYVALSRTRSLSDISASRAIVMGDFPINRRLMYFQEHGSI